MCTPADLADGAKVAAGDLSGFRGPITGESYGVTYEVLDAVLSHDAPEAICFVHQRSLAAGVEYPGHPVPEQPFQAVSVILACQLPVKEGNPNSTLRQTPSEIQAEIGFGCAAITEQDRGMPPQ
jgi:hypothetical protein